MRIRAALASLVLFGSTAGAQTFGGYGVQFNGSGGGSTPLVTGGVLRLTNDLYSSASSAFTTGTFAFSPATAWSTDFTLHYAFTSADVANGFSTGGDGIAFVMQGGAATALGGGGGGMGYDGMTNSLAVSFRSFWNDVLIGHDGTVGSQLVYGDGCPPAACVDAGLVIGVGDDFLVNVALSYDGANQLSVGYSTSRGFAFAPTIFTVDPSSLGSDVRLGFSAGSGSATQLAEVTDWTVSGLTYTPPVTSTPEPATISLVALGTMVVGIGARRHRNR